MDNTQTGLSEKQGDSYRLKKEAMWRSIIMEAHKDNLTRSAWCKKYYISEASFRRWEKYFIQKGEIKTSMTITHERYSASHKRHEKDLWKQRILAAYASNLSIKKWCEQNSVSDTYFYNWKKSLEMTGDIQKNLDGFCEKDCKNHSELQSEKEAMWKSIIMEANKDNLTRSAWCKKYHISEASFRRWEKYFIQKGEIKTNMTITHKQYKPTRKRKKDLWKQRILDAYSSDLTIKEWCEQNNVDASYICYLKKIFERSGDIPKNLVDARKQRRKGERTSREEKIQRKKEEKQRLKEEKQRLKEEKQRLKEEKQRLKEEKQRLKEEELSRKYENIVPVFCELPVPKEYIDTNDCISKGATFKVGKFSLLADEDVPEDMLCVALEALNTVMEVFEGDYRRS